MDIDTLLEAEDLTWRDILYEVIKSMDPWDIDLTKLATRYSEKVRTMREMNFRIPANVVLVSSVLLRMKADILHPTRSESYIELADSFNMLFGEEIPPISDSDVDDYTMVIKPSRMPKRRVTASELIEAIQKVLEEKGTKKTLLLQKKAGKETTIVVEHSIDITTLIEETYSRIVEILTNQEVVLFSDLAKTRDEIISTFMSVLHLWNSDRVHLSQERIFEEIYIRSSPLKD